MENLKKDFFISYNHTDEDDASWIAWTLEEAGYTVIIQTWDFRKGNNFAIEMDNALKNTNRTIAVLSPNFLTSDFTRPEWTAAFAEDPTGAKQKLIPVRVQKVEMANGLLAAINYIDMVGIDRETAKQKLLQGIEGKRSKPTTEPTPSFHLQRPNETLKALDKYTAAEYKIGQLNRTAQLQHFRTHISKECRLHQGKTFGFILAGSGQEWPVAIRFRLFHLLQKILVDDSKHAPVLVKLDADFGLTNEPAELEKFAKVENYSQYLWDLLGSALNWQQEQTALQERLSQLDECHIFYREVIKEEIKAGDFLTNLLTAWAKLQLHSSSKSHFLLFICEIDSPQQLSQEQTTAALRQCNLEQALLPKLCSPNYHDDIKNWIKLYIDNDTLRDSIDEALKGFVEQPNIPMITLKRALKPLIERYSSY